MQKRRIILASKSPRRKRLLEQIDLEFEICESSFDEDSIGGNFYSMNGLPINEVYVELRKMGAI